MPWEADPVAATRPRWVAARLRSAAAQHNMPTMYRYTAYGLTIEATQPLPELIAVDGTAQPDITISVGGVPLLPKSLPRAKRGGEGEEASHPVAGNEERRVYRLSPSGIMAFGFS